MGPRYKYLDRRILDPIDCASFPSARPLVPSPHADPPPFLLARVRSHVRPDPRHLRPHPPLGPRPRPLGAHPPPTAVRRPHLAKVVPAPVPLLLFAAVQPEPRARPEAGHEAAQEHVVRALSPSSPARDRLAADQICFPRCPVPAGQVSRAGRAHAPPLAPPFTPASPIPPALSLALVSRLAPILPKSVSLPTHPHASPLADTLDATLMLIVQQASSPPASHSNGAQKVSHRTPSSVRSPASHARSNRSTYTPSLSSSTTHHPLSLSASTFLSRPTTQLACATTGSSGACERNDRMAWYGRLRIHSQPGGKRK